MKSYKSLIESVLNEKVNTRNLLGQLSDIEEDVKEMISSVKSKDQDERLLVIIQKIANDIDKAIK